MENEAETHVIDQNVLTKLPDSYSKCVPTYHNGNKSIYSRDTKTVIIILINLVTN